MINSLQGKSVLLAGATGGLGLALATELAKRAAVLTLVGRNVDVLAAMTVEGSRHVADLRLPEACVDAVSAAIAHGGKLDVVINATGVVAFGMIEELSIDAMEELFLTNTFIPIMLAKASLPHVTEGGTIVNISGVIAEQNLPGMAAYGASKAAVASFSQALAREARRKKIHVLDVRPPHTNTALSHHPIEGTAPRMPEGLSPAFVAGVICDAIENNVPDLPSTAFVP
jgi:cyclic-di-GMP-binding biofilm dispersal mediator protein